MKNNVLHFLYEQLGEWVSGERIASALGCSRMTVANRIAELKREGFGIESNTRTGHRLTEMNDVLNQTALMLYFDGPVYFFERMDSTFKKGREIPEGGLVVAAAQTGGYGRRKRTFDCGEGGAYFGWVFTPMLAPHRANLITLAAGVAVCEAVKAYGIDARVKYPNDCYINGKKFCGILTECVMTSDTIEYADIGIGVNMHNRLPAELKEIATTLDEHGGERIIRAKLIGEIVDGIQNLLQNPDRVATEAERLSFFQKGDRLHILSDEGSEDGSYVGIDAEGYLIADTRGGARRVTVGEVSLRKGGTV